MTGENLNQEIEHVNTDMGKVVYNQPSSRQSLDQQSDLIFSNLQALKQRRLQAPNRRTAHQLTSHTDNLI